MPHAVIEYSANIEEEFLDAGICDRVHGTLMDCGLFKPQDIITRSYPANDFMAGEKGQDGSFVHATVSLFEGRTVEQKKGLSQAVLESLAVLNGVDSISVDIREIVKDIYRKIGA
ncbi:MAG: 5-carboxymethyl-2-hydroxymuconate Delta-isomerase [Alphaproteobacteria bacterium]